MITREGHHHPLAQGAIDGGIREGIGRGAKTFIPLVSEQFCHRHWGLDSVSLLHTLAMISENAIFQYEPNKCWIKFLLKKKGCVSPPEHW